MRNAPELVEVDSTRLEEVLRRVEQSLDEEDSALVRAVFESYAYVADLVEDKNTSIRRLRQLFFGARTETTEAVVGQKTRKRGASSFGPENWNKPYTPSFPGATGPKSSRFAPVLTETGRITEIIHSVITWSQYQLVATENRCFSSSFRPIPVFWSNATHAPRGVVAQSLRRSGAEGIPPPPMNLHQLDAHRHAQMRHDVQRPAPDPQLTCLASPLPAPQPIPEDPLDPPDRRLGQRAHVVAHRALPAPPALSPDGAQVLIARVRSSLGVAVDLDLGVLARRDQGLGPARRQGVVDLGLVVRPVGGRFGDRPLDLIQQIAEHLGVGDTGLGDHRRLDLVALGVHRQVELAPGATLGRAVLADLPLPLAIELQPGAVDDQLEGSVALLGQVDPRRGAAARQPAGVGDVQGQAQ